MSEQAADEKRAKQLEEARKRVEELKKKNKKGKKGKKSKKGEEETDSSQTAANESASEDKEESLLSTQKAQVEDTENLEPSESKATEATDLVDSNNEVPENAIEESNALSPGKASDSGQQPSETSTQEVAQDVTENSAERLQEQSEKTPQDVKDLFENDGSDFLDTIKKQDQDDKVQKLERQLEVANKELKKLKFVNMEQESTIEDLQQQVAELQDEMQTAQHELLIAEQELQKVKQARTPLQFAPFSTQPDHRDSYPASPHLVPTSSADRSALDKWRNWNIDMTSWRSIGSGPIVEL